MQNETKTIPLTEEFSLLLNQVFDDHPHYKEIIIKMTGCSLYNHAKDFDGAENEIDDHFYFHHKLLKLLDFLKSHNITNH